MVIVPLDAPGVDIEREPRVFGYQDRGGHPQVRFNDVRVPKANLLGEEGGGFAIAQAKTRTGAHTSLHASYWRRRAMS